MEEKNDNSGEAAVDETKLEDLHVRDASEHFATSKVFECHVGLDGDLQVYYLHERIAISKSMFFRTKAKEEWKQNSQTVSLAHLETSDFEVFVDWVYLNRLPSAWSQPGDGSKVWPAMMAAYSVADQLLCESMKNMIVDTCISRTLPNSNEHLIFADAMDLVNHDIADTKLGEFVFKTLARDIVGKRSKAGKDNFLAQHEAAARLLDMVCKFILNPWNHITMVNRCSFHDHIDTEKCS